MFLVLPNLGYNIISHILFMGLNLGLILAQLEKESFL